MRGDRDLPLHIAPAITGEQDMKTTIRTLMAEARVILGPLCLSLLCLILPAPASAQEMTITVTDGLYENRVELSWTAAPGSDHYFRVERDGLLLSVLSSSDSTYDDATGDPGVTYSYCVNLMDTAHQILDSACDDGSRLIFAPTSVQASDSLFVDGIAVTWSDRSTIEVGHRIYRRLVEDPPGEFALVGTTAANEEFYKDFEVEAGVMYEYEVAAFDEEGFESARGPDVRDVGARGYVMPPASVQATDGEHADRVVITWVDPTHDEQGFYVYRDRAPDPIATLDPDSTRYTDTGQLGVAHTYCVTAFTASRMLAQASGPALKGAVSGPPDVITESVPICDEGIGGTGTLTPPTLVQATDGTFDDRIEITWTDQSNLEVAFRIHRDGDPEPIGTVPANVTSFADQTADPS